MLDGIAKLNAMRHESLGDPEIETRIAQYEMAYRMQSSVPELMDLKGEPQSTYDLYGAEARTPGTFAANALLARRLVERGVRFVQLYHRDWDQHDNLPGQLAVNAKETDQPSAALVSDLKQRGLLDETLVIWGGEFGRTVFAQGGANKDNYGRDHHGRCFSIWMAGGGIKGGIAHGATDELGFHAVQDRHYVTDVHATILHQLGLDPRKLEVPGRKRLEIDYGSPIRQIIA